MKPETFNKLGLYINEAFGSFVYFYIDPRNNKHIAYNSGKLLNNILVSNKKFPSVIEDLFLEKLLNLKVSGHIQTRNDYVVSQILKMTEQQSSKNNVSNKLIEWLTK